MSLEKPGVESETSNIYPAEGYRKQVKNPDGEKQILQALLAELSGEV